MNFLKFTFLAATLVSVASVSAQSTYKSSLPVKPGKGVTVTGTVECDGKPVSGAIVSDGYELTKTDKKGAYYLKSKKQNPQVFITSPSGYEVVREDAIPQFWADFTSAPDQLERHDFRLNKVDNSNHAVVVFTDVHLANQRDDVAIFSGPYTEHIRKEVKKLTDNGIPVYAINLGDASWDNYWYAHDYKIGNFRQTLKDANFPVAVYSVMGNHDNDPHAQAGADVDFNASLPYQKALGPRYYSQNIGNVHYVFLDNIIYINEPAGETTYLGINSRRNYDYGFTRDQLDWLKKDLANVPYDTPVVVSMHAPLNRFKGATMEVKMRGDEASNKELFDMLKPYKNVRTFSGHSHREMLTPYPGEYSNIWDHNVNGTCASWWRSRAFGLKNICPDGSPAGYDIFNVNGNNITWKHKSYEEPDTKGFFAMDGNAVKHFYNSNPEMQTYLRMYPKASNLRETLPDNQILINLWLWEPQGKLVVKENGKEIPVEMYEGENPIHTVNYLLRNIVWINDWNRKKYNQPELIRMFAAKATTPDAPIEICWTDRFGREYKEILERPAPFKPLNLND